MQSAAGWRPRCRLGRRGTVTWGGWGEGGFPPPRRGEGPRCVVEALRCFESMGPSGAVRLAPPGRAGPRAWHSARAMGRSSVAALARSGARFGGAGRRGLGRRMPRGAAQRACGRCGGGRAAALWRVCRAWASAGAVGAAVSAAGRLVRPACGCLARRGAPLAPALAWRRRGAGGGGRRQRARGRRARSLARAPAVSARARCTACPRRRTILRPAGGQRPAPCPQRRRDQSASAALPNLLAPP
jgi:hypothetical protein